MESLASSDLVITGGQVDEAGFLVAGDSVVNMNSNGAVIQLSSLWQARYAHACGSTFIQYSGVESQAWTPVSITGTAR